MPWEAWTILVWLGVALLITALKVDKPRRPTTIGQFLVVVVEIVLVGVLVVNLGTAA